MSSDDELQYNCLIQVSKKNLPNSDGEGQDRLRFKSFVSKDLPIFKVRTLFESVELLRKAVTEYSLRESVDVHLVRNERKSTMPSAVLFMGTVCIK
jgi:hypothetical protein